MIFDELVPLFEETVNSPEYVVAALSSIIWPAVALVRAVCRAVAVVGAVRLVAALAHRWHSVLTAPMGFELPQTLADPAPPQDCGEVHVPHEVTVRDVPQLSAAVTLPQFLPSREQNVVSVSGVHDAPHTLAVPLPAQVWGEVHVPHEVTVRDVPQLSAAVT